MLDPRWGEPSSTHDPHLLANFQPRRSDVLITTAAKAGTTWMQQILYQLHNGGDGTFNAINDVVPWLELPKQGKTWSQQLAEYETRANPRLFKTHCTFEQTPGGVDTARIILSSRDPRDCCVSFYHHVMDFTDEARTRIQVAKPASFDAYVEEWLVQSGWYRNVQSWWPYYNHPNVLWLRYEDMKQDLPRCIERLCRFLDLTIASTQMETILQHCSFAWMKAHADKFSSQMFSGKPLFKPGGFIRKGLVGDHKTLLNPDQAQRILDQARATLAPEALTFLGINH